LNGWVCSSPVSVTVERSIYEYGLIVCCRVAYHHSLFECTVSFYTSSSNQASNLFHVSRKTGLKSCSSSACSHLLSSTGNLECGVLKEHEENKARQHDTLTKHARHQHPILPPQPLSHLRKSFSILKRSLQQKSRSSTIPKTKKTCPRTK